MNLYEEVPDDTRCGHCGRLLPPDPRPDTPQFDGFCSGYCQHKYEHDYQQAANAPR